MTFIPISHPPGKPIDKSLHPSRETAHFLSTLPPAGKPNAMDVSWIFPLFRGALNLSFQPGTLLLCCYNRCRAIRCSCKPCVAVFSGATKWNLFRVARQWGIQFDIYRLLWIPPAIAKCMGGALLVAPRCCHFHAEYQWMPYGISTDGDTVTTHTRHRHARTGARECGFFRFSLPLADASLFRSLSDSDDGFYASLFFCLPKE